MKYFVYVLRNLRDRKRYVGMTTNIESRLSQHNAGRVFSTKSRRPFEIVHIEEFPDRISARRREKYLKSGIGRELLDGLLK